MSNSAYIVAGYRSAVGKAGRGGFRFYRPDDIGASVIKHLVKSLPNLDKEKLMMSSLEMLLQKQNKDSIWEECYHLWDWIPIKSLE